MKTLPLACLIAALAAPAVVSAQPVDARRDLQMAAIKHGVEDGSLTRQEEARLRAQQDHIHKVEEQMRHRNWEKLTNHDREILRRMEDQADRTIQALRHNSAHQHGKP